MPETTPIRVMIVDDHALLRIGLSLFLDSFDDLVLVGEAADGAEAIRVCAEVNPDVVLMDLMMPGVNGVEATRAIRETHPKTQVVIFTSFHSGELAQAALEAGAVQCLVKNASIDKLAEVIRAAHKATVDEGEDLTTCTT